MDGLDADLDIDSHFPSTLDFPISFIDVINAPKQVLLLAGDIAGSVAIYDA